MSTQQNPRARVKIFKSVVKCASVGINVSDVEMGTSSNVAARAEPTHKDEQLKPKRKKRKPTNANNNEAALSEIQQAKKPILPDDPQPVDMELPATESHTNTRELVEYSHDCKENSDDRPPITNPATTLSTEWTQSRNCVVEDVACKHHLSCNDCKQVLPMVRAFWTTFRCSKRMHNNDASKCDGRKWQSCRKCFNATKLEKAIRARNPTHPNDTLVASVVSADSQENLKLTRIPASVVSERSIASMLTLVPASGIFETTVSSPDPSVVPLFALQPTVTDRACVTVACGKKLRYDNQIGYCAACSRRGVGHGAQDHMTKSLKAIAAGLAPLPAFDAVTWLSTHAAPDAVCKECGKKVNTQCVSGYCAACRQHGVGAAARHWRQRSGKSETIPSAFDAGAWKLLINRECGTAGCHQLLRASNLSGFCTPCQQSAMSNDRNSAVSQYVISQRADAASRMRVSSAEKYVEWIKQHRTKCCVDGCAIDHPSLIELNHSSQLTKLYGEKKFQLDVNTFLCHQDGQSEEWKLEEKKVEELCIKHHAWVTYSTVPHPPDEQFKYANGRSEKFSWFQSRMLKLQLDKNGGCVCCGARIQRELSTGFVSAAACACFELDHKSRTTKSGPGSANASDTGLQLLCCYCHRMKTHAETYHIYGSTVATHYWTKMPEAFRNWFLQQTRDEDWSALRVSIGTRLVQGHATKRKRDEVAEQNDKEVEIESHKFDESGVQD